MSNITMTVEDDLVQNVRKVAVDKNTTLTVMVRQYLETVAQRDESRKKRAIVHIRSSFKRLSRDMGSRTWRREDLYAR
jgi:hypothetical protein